MRAPTDKEEFTLRIRNVREWSSLAVTLENKTNFQIEFTVISPVLTANKRHGTPFKTKTTFT